MVSINFVAREMRQLGWLLDRPFTGEGWSWQRGEDVMNFEAGIDLCFSVTMARTVVGGMVLCRAIETGSFDGPMFDVREEWT